jgi:hypothetical protein
VSLSVLEKELRYLHEAGTRYLVFVDDTFNVPLPRFKQLLRIMIDSQWNFQWISYFRCSNADEEAFDLMAKRGCIGTFLGIESGDIHMDKFATVERYKLSIKQLHNRGVLTFASVICGFPGETEETVRNTVQFIEDACPSFFSVQLYYHDTRSPIARRSEEFGITGGGYSWRHRTMNWTTAATCAKRMYRSLQNSIPLTTYSFSIWRLPYLLSKGINMPEIHKFGKVAREILVRGLTTNLVKLLRTLPDCAMFAPEQVWRAAMPQTQSVLDLLVEGIQAKANLDPRNPIVIEAVVGNRPLEALNRIWL